MKEQTKLVLLILLISSLFMKKIDVNKDTFNVMVAISIIIFAVSIVSDLMLGLLFVSIAYVISTKLVVRKEKFSDKDTKPKDVKEQKEKKPEPKKNATENKKETVVTKPKVVQDAHTKLPEHCSKIKDIYEEFIKEYAVNSKNLADVQNNIFDKYNYDVFYNELGENSLDIQGIFNHEVNGFEKPLY